MIKIFVANLLISLMLLGYLFIALFFAYIFGINNINILLGLLVGTALYSPVIVFSLIKYGKFYKKNNIKNEAQHIRNVEKEYVQIVENENNSLK